MAICFWKLALSDPSLLVAGAQQAAAAEAAADAEADEADPDEQREAYVDDADRAASAAAPEVEEHQAERFGSTWSMICCTVGCAACVGGRLPDPSRTARGLPRRVRPRRSGA